MTCCTAGGAVQVQGQGRLADLEREYAKPKGRTDVEASLPSRQHELECLTR